MHSLGIVYVLSGVQSLVVVDPAWLFFPALDAETFSAAFLQVGVYLGVCGSEVHALWLGDVRNITGYEQTGCTMSMLANRLSFFYGFKGPSKAVDTGT